MPNGIPSHDTLARVFARRDPEALQASFQSWIQSASQVLAAVITIDDKALRQAYDQGGERGMIYRVSAEAIHSHLVLGQRQVEEKSNQITAVPELLSRHRPLAARKLASVI
ncbi:MAG: ISAs1 family transposase [Spirulinaceae cyanobacterium SM2_1_0]|nr:ISAs1 family transposase [Spirulinaceae cyanobacterium SM2_1_0]